MTTRSAILVSGLFWCVVALLNHNAFGSDSLSHVRVVWRGDAATQAIVSWSTATAGDVHALQIRAAGEETWNTIPCEQNLTLGESSDADAADAALSPLHIHHVPLANLKPATKYEIVAVSDLVKSSTFSFTTAPADNRPTQLLYGGDSRSGWEHRQKMNRLLQRLVTEAERQGRPPVLALAHGGDFVNRGHRIDQWRQWLDDHELTTSDEGRLLPIIPTRGNHDYGEPFNAIFGFQAGDANYYTTQLSPAIRLLTLNTETTTAGDQRNWLASELTTIAPISRWLLCQYHKPAFPAVKVPSGALTNWVPLFEQYDVDLCLEADGHCIKRTPPIRNNRIDPTGVVYVGEGGLGVGQRTPKTNRWYLQPPAVTGRGHHVHLLTFDRDR
ncbi:MAG: metallophosphoesterase family protein, partial [Planctomycetota bacterium]